MTAIALLGVLAMPARADAPTGWTGQSISGSATVLDVVTPGVALAGGFQGLLARTVDGGQTWTPTTPPSDAQIRALSSTDGNTIFAVDSRGALRRSADAGATWTDLAPASGVQPVGIAAFRGRRLLVAGRRSLLLSSDLGDSFKSVTPKLARTDLFRGVDRAGEGLIVYGPHALLSSTDSATTWHHLKLPPLGRGDSVYAVDFVAARVGYVLSGFRRLFKTRDAGHHWHELLGTGGAGADIAFADRRHGFIAAPGFANRFDGYVLATRDGGATWRPQPVSSRFLGKVGAAGMSAFAIGNEGSSLFSSATRGESGTAISVGFRAAPRVPRRGRSVRIRGRVAGVGSGVGVAVSMRSGTRWIVRFVHTNSKGIFTAKFSVQRRSWVVAQVPAGDGHGSAASKPVFVRVK